MLSFVEYLRSKKIDSARFQATEPEKFAAWQAIFEQVHPDSFTAQKKFFINDLRRRYLLKKPDNQ